MAILEHWMSKIDLSNGRLLDRRLSQPDFFSAQIADARRFHLRLSSTRGSRLSVICGGLECCASDYRIRRANFPYFGLEFVAGGSGELYMKGKPVRLVPGTFFIYGPRIKHLITTDPATPLVKYFADFSGSSATRRLQAIGLTPGSAHQSSAPAEVMPIFDALVRNGSKNTPQSSAICSALLEALLGKLSETRMKTGSVETAAFDTYQRCLRMLEENVMQTRSLEALSELCGVDAAYLCRLFKRFGHESPYQRLVRLKMTRAAAQLQIPGRLVKQVAAEFGFADQYHFSRAFKSVFGVSPTRSVRE